MSLFGSMVDKFRRVEKGQRKPQARLCHSRPHCFNHQIKPAFAGDWLILEAVPLSTANSLLGASYQLYTHSETKDTVLRTTSYSLPHVGTRLGTTDHRLQDQSIAESSRFADLIPLIISPFQLSVKHHQQCQHSISVHRKCR